MRALMSMLAPLLLAAVDTPRQLEVGGLLDQRGAPVSEKAFLARVRTVQLVLVGESHGSDCDHEAQRRVIELMASDHLAPALAMEMLAEDRARALELFNQRRMGVEALGKGLGWQASWGYPFALYRRLFATAARFNLPVVSLDLPSQAVFLLAHHGDFPQEVDSSRATDPEAAAISPAQIAELSEDLEMRGDVLDDESLDPDRLALLQAELDSGMAEQAQRALDELSRPVVVLAGSGHFEAAGLPDRLHAIAPETTMLTMLPWRGPGLPASGSADVFFYCPAGR
jgi:uncharacterized iron-regulated protein